jgi:hypothetical protein
MNFQFKAPQDNLQDKNRDEFEELPGRVEREIEEEDRLASEESLEGTA